MRICFIYDCLFPWTVGGGERWYRNLAERLASAGHEITYLTLRQWDAGEEPAIAGVNVVAVGPRMNLYRGGKRRVLPPLCFGAGVLWHLIRHRRSYDQLHMASFPFFSLLAAAAVRPFAGYSIAVDWFEVWSRSYWTDYLGRAGGRIGWIIQKLCARVPQHAYCFSRLHGERLKELGLRRSPTLLKGLYEGEEGSPLTAGSTPTLVYAGRLIPEKRVELFIEALPAVIAQEPRARAVVFGAGPERERLEARIAELELEDFVSMRGFVQTAEVEDAMRRATVVVQPSAREGYGLVVVEAAARGVPVVVAPGDDNAAVELVENGRNGFVAATADPCGVADAILACLRRGDELRASTRSWYARNKDRLSLRQSQQVIESQYRLSCIEPRSEARLAGV